MRERIIRGGSGRPGSTSQPLADKGKPRATWGRKATGLVRDESAGLPKKRRLAMTAFELAAVRTRVRLLVGLAIVVAIALAGSASARI